MMAGDDYEELILDHFRSPYHKRPLESATCSWGVRNPLCGDWINLQLLLDGEDRIAQASFTGQGCVISQAAASILCEHLDGRPVVEIKTFGAEQMLELLRIPLTPYRRRYGLLAWDALQAMLEEQAVPAVNREQPVEP